ncbi:hypothetical protein B14911_25915 [Bacillus sp. NRRL B-14911]|nr:hypothetical protein B14911_25915 [Bacillus sp. NRRL B-14911]
MLYFTLIACNFLYPVYANIYKGKRNPGSKER